MHTGYSVVFLGAVQSITTIIVKDEGGAAATNNITILPYASEHIDGASSFVLSAARGYVALYTNGVDWFTIAYDTGAWRFPGIDSNYPSGAKINAQSQGAAGTTGLLIKSNVADNGSSVSTVFDVTTPLALGIDYLWRSGGNEVMRWTRQATYLAGGAYGMYFAQSMSLLASGGLFLAAGGATSAVVVDASAMYPNTAEVYHSGYYSRRWLGVWSDYVSTAKGSAIASATTIAPTKGITHITGTTSIATITPPDTNFTGTLKLITDSALSFIAGGNIAASGRITTVAGQIYDATYDGSVWYIK